MNAQVEEKEFVSFRDKRQSVKMTSKKGNHHRWWIGGLAAVLLIFLFWWWRSDDGIVGFSFPGKISSEMEDGRITVLLLGNAGGKHDGATLTDSIIVASYEPKSRRVVLISVPRDLWLDDINEKVNAVYQAGVKKDDGLGFAREEIGKIVGMPIDYALRLDFSGFVKAVDLVGGIEVEVPVTFDDYNYPIEGMEDELCGNVDQEMDLTAEQAAVLKVDPGKRRVLVTPNGQIATSSADFACRFEHVRFESGKRQMNGAQALVFVRSRMGTNGEGSDFARSRRQQRVLEAFRTKALSLETLANPQKVFGLLETFGKSFETDIPTSKMLDFYNRSKNISKIESIVLGQLSNGKSLFINPPVGQYGAWVLVPPDNDFSGVIELVRQVLDRPDSMSSAVPSPSVVGNK